MPKQTNQARQAAPVDTGATVEVLNRIMRVELDGVMQYFQHRSMCRWLRASRARALAVGQQIAALTDGPEIGVDELTASALASSQALLDAARNHEKRRVDEYRRLLELVEGRGGALEAFARAQLEAGEQQLGGRTANR